MTLHAFHNNTDANLQQRLLAASNLTLSHIARAAPLDQTLACIVNGIEEQYPEISVAILLPDEDGDRLYLGAAPSLPQDYRLAVNAHAAGVGVWSSQLARDANIQITAEYIQKSRFWRRFCDVALQFGLHASWAIPIQSATNCMLGMFIVYSQQSDRTNVKHRQAIVDVTALASIAIERYVDGAKIKEAENTLRERETRMALAIEGSGTGVWDRNILTGEIHYSAGWKALLGYTDAEISNRIEESYSRVHPDDLLFVQATIQAHFEGKTDSYAVDHRIRCKDGNYKWISSRGKVVSRDIDGMPLRMIGITTDITSMRVLSDRLQQSVDLITCLTNEIPGLVYQYRQMPNGAAYFSYASEGIGDIYELSPEHLADNVSLLDDIIHPDDLANYRASLEASAASLIPWNLEYRVILPRQGLCWRNGNARPRRLPDGSTLWHGFITDVTERKRIEIELNEFAKMDFLTQLPNRRYFMAQMGEELARIQRGTDTCTAVLMCDLDHFKIINDSYGHAIGDRVLKHFASILRNELRKNDTVGRVGGEEFAVMLSGAGVAEANAFAKRVQKQVAEMPLLVGDQTISVTVSIGITVMKVTDTSADASLSRSDVALYRAKENGRNRIEIGVG